MGYNSRINLSVMGGQPREALLRTNLSVMGGQPHEALLDRSLEEGYQDRVGGGELVLVIGEHSEGLVEL